MVSPVPLPLSTAPLNQAAQRVLAGFNIAVTGVSPVLETLGWAELHTHLIVEVSFILLLVVADTHRMQSLPSDTCVLRPFRYSLSTFRPRTSLVTSSSSSFNIPLNSSLSSFSLVGLRRESPLLLFGDPIWNGNPFVCSQTKRRDFGLLVPPLRCEPSSNGNSVQGERSLMQWIELIGEALSTAFPVWVALGCVLGLLRPASYAWVQPRWTVLGITLTMLGMGMTLTLDDLRGALAMPKELISGFVLQYSVSSFVYCDCAIVWTYLKFIDFFYLEKFLAYAA